MSDIAATSPLGSNHHGAASPVTRAPAASLNHDSPRLIGASEPGAIGSAAVDGDRVEVSDFARYLAHLRQLPEVRHDRVEQVRQSIDNETYESDEKLDVAIERWAREEL